MAGLMASLGPEQRVMLVLADDEDSDSSCDESTDYADSDIKSDALPQPRQVVQLSHLPSWLATSVKRLMMRQCFAWRLGCVQVFFEVIVHDLLSVSFLEGCDQQIEIRVRKTNN
ncbi:unnamed protein product [Clonostachys rhizophaga]|uniref:Uncharacterized protein n=1 Tax=Clonostachys rhizophaga TaxID=160324 RepID=A0A9N9YQ59_9HYPO|nr:unnamed protein product [Clonostachys rhizophaga]